MEPVLLTSVDVKRSVLVVLTSQQEQFQKLLAHFNSIRRDTLCQAIFNERNRQFVPTEITQILDRIADGNSKAIEELVPLVYDQMRQIAAAALRREPNNPFDPTELVHETYLRMIGNENLAWKSRSHFYGACAVVIRRVLVDQAKAQNRLKRGGNFERVSIEDNELAAREPSFDLIALDEAMQDLERLSPRQAKLVELRYFGGLTENEAAEVLQVSRRTVGTDWTMARAWLAMRLTDI